MTRSTTHRSNFSINRFSYSRDYLGRIRSAVRYSRSLIFSMTILCLLFVSGCSTKLQVFGTPSEIEGYQQSATVAAKANMLEGIVYYLPMAVFDVEITWHLKSCPDSNSKENAAVNLTARLTERYVADSATPHVIDYQALNAPLTHTNLKVSLYPNGTLQSINGTVESKASTVLASTLNIASSLSQVFSLQALGTDDQIRCNPMAAIALINKNELLPQIKMLKEDILKTSTIVPLDHEKLRELKSELQVRHDALSSYTNKTSFTQKFFWAPSDLDEHIDFIVSSTGYQKLFHRVARTSGYQTMATDPSNQGPDTFPPNCVFATIASSSVTVTNGTRRHGGIHDVKDNPNRHLYYRVPIVATIALGSGLAVSNYSDDDPNAIECQTQGSKLIATKEVQLPQAGFHVALPLENTAFDRNNIIAEFNANGSLKEFHYITDAQAEGLAQALAGTAKTAAEILETAKSKELKELQARTALLKAEADLIEAERILRALKEQDETGE